MWRFRPRHRIWRSRDNTAKQQSHNRESNCRATWEAAYLSYPFYEHEPHLESR